MWQDGLVDGRVDGVYLLSRREKRCEHPPGKWWRYCARSAIGNVIGKSHHRCIILWVRGVLRSIRLPTLIPGQPGISLPTTMHGGHPSGVCTCHVSSCHVGIGWRHAKGQVGGVCTSSAQSL